VNKKLNTSIALLFLIMLVAFIVRATYLRLDYMSEGVPDDYGYETTQIAASVAAGHGFGNPYPVVHTGPTALMPPVYIYLLAGIDKVFGVHSSSAYLAATMLSGLFSTLVCIPIFFLGKRVAGDAMGVSAAAFWAVFPLAVTATAGPFGVWDTTLSTLLAALVLLATLRIRDSDRTAAWVGYGLLCALTLETNPTILSVLPFLFAWLAWHLYQHRREWLRLPGLAALLIVLGCAPWAARNWITFHHLIPFRSNFGLELWLGNNDYPDHDQFPDTRSPYSNGIETQHFAAVGEVAYMREKTAIAAQFIETHPWETVRSDYLRFVVLWDGISVRVQDVWPLISWPNRISFAINALLAICGWTGLLAMFRLRNPFAWPFFAYLAFYPAVYYVTHATLRYRHPVDPALTVLASYAIVCAGRALVRAPAQPAASAAAPHPVSASNWRGERL
jgi:4-amino-4-deoxy-L-arabinose transferase-like glycosyltransferase